MDGLLTAPAIVAVIVGLLIWRRHRADRRARLFLALAASELAFGLPLLLALTLPQTPLGVAALDGFLLTVALVSTTIYLHFGLAFPHARPWLRGGRINSFYLAAAIVGIVPVVAALAGPWAQAAVQDALDGIMGLTGVLGLAGAVAACVSIVRSYREMTADERQAYRVPVMGVLAGLAASLAFGGDNRYAVWTANALVMAGELLLPLFFFMASYRYRLLERHSQDYVTKL